MADTVEKYPGAKVWTLQSDGAPAKCAECSEEADLSQLLLTETPNGRRSVNHRECLDEHWLARATEMGRFKV